MVPFYIFIIVALFYLVVALLYLFTFLKKKKKGFIKPLFLLILALFLLDMTVFEPYSIKVRQENLDINKLNREIKIAVLSDFHLSPLKRGPFVKKVAQELQKLQPNLIVITGDFLFFDHFETFKNDFSSFKELSDIAPTYTVLGNHDYGLRNSLGEKPYRDQHIEISDKLKEAGIKILVDEKEKINLNGQDFWLIGFDEYWKKDSHPGRALAGLNDNLLKIGLSHNPDNGFLPQAKVLDILLSGHTHGGQIRLPFIGPLGDGETLLAKKNYGSLYAEHEPKILNTSGIGESGLPIRFLNKPEIILLTIK